MPPIQEPDKIFGSPDTDAMVFPGKQSYPDTCAIRCQEHILEVFTGMDIDENQLVQEAAINGWYAPGEGTPLADVGKLLELHGVPVNQYQDATVFNLANELAQGHKVIIGVDSGELWEGKSILGEILDAVGLSGADHAVVVSGIDTTDPDNIKVIISDPGTGEPAVSYPMDAFIDAWKDSDFFMVATQQPAPPWIPEMTNFDYDNGHIPSIGDIPYDTLQDYLDDPAQWADISFSQLHPEFDATPIYAPEASESRVDESESGNDHDMMSESGNDHDAMMDDEYAQDSIDDLDSMDDI